MARNLTPVRVVKGVGMRCYAKLVDGLLPELASVASALDLFNNPVSRVPPPYVMRKGLPFVTLVATGHYIKFTDIVIFCRQNLNGRKFNRAVVAKP